MNCDDDADIGADDANICVIDSQDQWAEINNLEGTWQFVSGQIWTTERFGDVEEITFIKDD